MIRSSVCGTPATWSTVTAWYSMPAIHRWRATRRTSGSWSRRSAWCWATTRSPSGSSSLWATPLATLWLTYRHGLAGRTGLAPYALWSLRPCLARARLIRLLSDDRDGDDLLHLRRDSRSLDGCPAGRIAAMVGALALGSVLFLITLTRFDGIGAGRASDAVDPRNRSGIVRTFFSGRRCRSSWAWRSTTVGASTFYGDPLPNTFYAKSSSLADQIRDGLAYV